jgi:hypothetical protein
MEELWEAYNGSGLLTMILQELTRWDDYARCMGVGQRQVRVMRYDPTQRHYHPSMALTARWNKPYMITPSPFVAHLGMT